MTNKVIVTEVMAIEEYIWDEIAIAISQSIASHMLSVRQIQSNKIWH